MPEKVSVRLSKMSRGGATGWAFIQKEMAGEAEILLLSVKKPSSHIEEGGKVIVESKNLFLILQRLPERFFLKFQLSVMLKQTIALGLADPEIRN